MVKYLTGQLTMEDSRLHLEPLYFPSVSLGDTLYLRIICGNFKPDLLEVMIEGGTLSNKKLLVPSMPTVYETKLTKEFFKNILSDNPTPFKLVFMVTINNKKYEYTSEDLIYIQGLSFGADHLTDVSELFDRLNEILDELRGRL